LRLAADRAGLWHKLITKISVEIDQLPETTRFTIEIEREADGR
jgi:hypothetical protein